LNSSYSKSFAIAFHLKTTVSIGTPFITCTNNLIQNYFYAGSGSPVVWNTIYNTIITGSSSIHTGNWIHIAVSYNVFINFNIIGEYWCC
jgi:hypothetical protein